MLVSSGVIVSLILVKLGFEKADGVLALLVAVAIAYTAFTILRGVGRTLGDAARLPAAEVAAVAGRRRRRRGVPLGADARFGEPGVRGPSPPGGS